MSCPSCFTGTIHEGTPKGSTTVLHGRKTYVADPPTSLAPKPIVVIISDAFGWNLVNTRVMADDIARKSGFQVLVPDFMDGQEAPLWLLDIFPRLSQTGLLANLQKPYHGLRAAYAFLPFLYTNRFSIAWPKITAFFTALRTAAGPSIPIGAAGYCWGGKHAINLAHGLTLPLHLAKYTDGTRTLIDCAFAAHPAGLDGDGIAEIEKIVMPLSIAIGDKDMVMGMKMVEGIRKCLDKKRESKEGKVESEVVVYPGAKHGFAVRGDPGNEREMEQGVQAEEQAVRWFARWLVMGITQDE